MHIRNIFKKKVSKNRTVDIKGSSICEGAQIINSRIADGAKLESTTVAKDAKIVESSVAKNAEIKNSEIAKNAEIKNSEIAKNADISHSTIAKNANAKNRVTKAFSINRKYAIIVLSISVIIIIVSSLLATGWSITPILITISGLSGLWAFLNLLLSILKYLNKKVE